MVKFSGMSDMILYETATLWKVVVFFGGKSNFVNFVKKVFDIRGELRYT